MANITLIDDNRSGQHPEGFIANKTVRSNVAASVSAVRTRVVRANTTKIVSDLFVGRPRAGGGNPTWIDGKQSSMNHPSGSLLEILSERFRILRQLSTGAEAELYEVKEVDSTQQAVIKLYWPSVSPDEAVMEKLRQHPSEHYVRLREFGWADGRYYELMEFVPGPTLRQFLDNTEVTSESCRQIFEELVAALIFLHGSDPDGPGVIHRDIKPENYMIHEQTSLDGTLIDFGISVPVSSQPTGEGRQFTPRYAAPEAIAGDVSPAVDYWSLGMVVLETVTGAHPFDGFEDQFVEELVRDGWPTSLPSTLTASWRTLCKGLLEREPMQRWGAREVQDWMAAVSQDDNESGRITSDGATIYVGDQACNSLQELALALYRDWTSGIALVESGVLHQWFEDNFPDSNVTRVLKESRQQHIHSGLQVLRAIYLIDNQRDPAWMGRKLRSNEIEVIASRAESGDSIEQSCIEELFDLCVLDEIGRFGRRNECVAQHAAWANFVGDFEVARAEARRFDGPTGLIPPRPVFLAILYKLSTSESAREKISQQAKNIIQHQISPCTWLNALANTDRPGTLARQLLISLLRDDLENRARTDLAIKSDLDKKDPKRAVGQEVQRRNRTGAPVTASLFAYHWDIYFTYQGQRVVVGKHVRLQWRSSNATWLYLRGYGRLREQGVLNLTLGRSETFQLRVRGPSGRVTYRLPEICFEPPALRQGLTEADLRQGLIGADLRRGLARSDLRKGLNGSDLRRGLTSADLRRGLTEADLPRGLTEADLCQGLTSTDLRRGLTEADLPRGLTEADLCQGLTGADLRRGLTSQDLRYPPVGDTRESAICRWYSRIRRRVARSSTSNAA